MLNFYRIFNSIMQKYPPLIDIFEMYGSVSLKTIKIQVLNKRSISMDEILDMYGSVSLKTIKIQVLNKSSISMMPKFTSLLVRKSQLVTLFFHFLGLGWAQVRTHCSARCCRRSRCSGGRATSG